MPQSQFCVLPYLQSTKENQVAKLLDMLPEGGPRVFHKFLCALRVTGQPFLATELQEQANTARMDPQKAARMEQEQMEPTPTEGRRHTDHRRTGRGFRGGS